MAGLTDRRVFLKVEQAARPVRLGVIGTGNRGRSLLSDLLLMPGLEFPALECPDFTRGRWKTKKPAFGVEG